MQGVDKTRKRGADGRSVNTHTKCAVKIQSRDLFISYVKRYKVELSTENAMKAQRRSRGIVLLDWGWEINATPRQLYPPEFRYGTAVKYVTIDTKDQGHGHLIAGHEGLDMEYRYRSTTALNRDRWSTRQPLYPRERLGTHCIGG
jgi:hypothetical protein